VVVTETAASRDVGPGEASYRFWVSLILFFLAFGFGTTWDRAWHTNHPFEDFYSPPHLFIYTTFALSGLAFLSVLVSPRRREWFGPEVRVPLPSSLARLGTRDLEVPASLLLTLSGCATVAFGGMLDNLWHSTFGLDETAWSTPHAMLGWGILADLGRLSLVEDGAGPPHIDLAPLRAPRRLPDSVLGISHSPGRAGRV